LQQENKTIAYTTRKSRTRKNTEKAEHAG